MGKEISCSTTSSTTSTSSGEREEEEEDGEERAVERDNDTASTFNSVISSCIRKRNG